MKAILTVFVVTLLFAVPASASTIVWGPTVVTTDDSSFLNGAGVTAGGPDFLLSLPNFSTSSQFSFPPNSLQMFVAPTITGGDIYGVEYTFLGSFSGAGFADFSQTINGAVTTGSFSSNSYTGQVTFASLSSLQLLAAFNLNDEGDTAAITGIRLHLLATPEPSSLVLLTSGLVLLVWLKLRRPLRPATNIE